jgi:hypothetical protein
MTPPRVSRIANDRRTVCWPDAVSDARSWTSNGEPVRCIEDDRVIVRNGRLVHGAFTVAHDVHRVSLLSESLGEHLRRPRLVFYEENPHSQYANSARASTGGNPDAIFYEPAHKEVYAFNGSGNSARVFDAAAGPSGDVSARREA